MSQTSDDESTVAGGQVASVEPAATLYPPASQSDESIRVLVRVRPNLQREEGSSQAVFVEGGKVGWQVGCCEIAFHKSFCRPCTFGLTNRLHNAQCTQHLMRMPPKRMYLALLVTVSIM